MTLLDDLEHAAELAHFAAVHAGTLPSAAEARFRAHAARLRAEISKADEKSLLPWSQGRTKALLERINGGPPETDEGVAP